MVVANRLGTLRTVAPVILRFQEQGKKPDKFYRTKYAYFTFIRELHNSDI